MRILKSLFKRRPLECIWVLMIVVLAIFAPYVTSYDPYLVDLGQRLQGPSRQHLFGTDEFGRDLLTRVIYGTRVVLYAVLLSGLLSLVGGVTVGLTAGYFGGRIDLVLSRCIDAIQAFPDVLIGLVLAAAMGPSLLTAVLCVSSFGVPFLARVVRGSVLEIKQMEYVEACRALGASNLYILKKAVLPNVMSPIIIQITNVAPRAIITVAGLSFLGLGAQPPRASWGAMIAQAREYMYQCPSYLTIVASILSLTVIFLNLLGDAIRDIFARN